MPPVAYVVSRFPVASETFILREINALSDEHGLEVELHVLFRAVRPFVHPDAERWVERVRRVSPAQGVAGLAWWLRREPVALIKALGSVLAGYARTPRLLARALITFALAAGHARQITDEGAGHVHAHFATYPALTAWLCRRLTGVGYSITAHAHDIFVDQSHLHTVVSEADFVVAISEFNRGFLAVYGGDRATPVHVVRCGLRASVYDFRPRAAPAEGPVRALCVASFEEYKGHGVLLDALAADPGLARLELDLVGAGSLEDELRAHAERLGIAGRVHFLGTRSEGEVAAMLAVADLFVLPSVVASDGQMEGIPVALMEALASGVPTVATRLSGIPELVEDGVTGTLAEPGDAAAMAAALRRVIDDPKGTRQLLEAGRERVEHEFAIDTSAAQLAALFAAPGPAAQRQTAS
ncbi:MAG TPA: glycosyltransferase [Conexibacter sp.]|jgi:glycosyltransferase involved in cell wall biosynthesis